MFLRMLWFSEQISFLNTYRRKLIKIEIFLDSCSEGQDSQKFYIS